MSKKVQEPPPRIIDGENLRKEWEGVSKYLRMKELLKPPFTWQLWSGVLRIKLNDHTLIEFKNLEIGSSHYLDILDFVAEAIHEKWKREFGEPFREKREGR